MSAGKHIKHRKRRKAAPIAEDKESFLRKHHLWSKFLIPLVVFCWPFLYLFRHVFPINGNYSAIGNDFILLYYKYKVYLLACLADFRFPLWSPAEGAGFPFYTNPFTQAFYPLNLLLVLWYKITGGYNPLDHQAFTVLGISIFALGVFMWLRLINTNLRSVIFATLVMSVSFKVTEMIRFPNAVHTAAWHPWILYVLTRILLSKSFKDTIVSGLLLTLFLICLLTGGYPYYVYYCIFLFTPYLLAFIVKPLRERLFGPCTINWKRAFGTFIFAGCAAIAICAPYVIGIKRLMAETIARAGKDFAYSTAHIFNFEDTLGSLVYPPAASTEGWYFFSIAGLLLILLYLFTGKTIHRKFKGLDDGKEIQTSRDRSELWIKLFFVIWICIITYISYGRHSYLFKLLWHYMPGFSSLRVWGRLNIILVPILAWLLSIAYGSFESKFFNKKVYSPDKRSLLASPVAILTAVYTVILIIQIYFYHNNIQDRLWPIFFKHVSANRSQFLAYGAAAFVVIFLILILNKRFSLKSNRALTAVLVVVVLVAVLEMRHVGVRTWTYQSPIRKERIHLDLAQYNEASFHMLRTERKDTIGLGPNFSTGVLPYWYFGRYNKFLQDTENEQEARRTLLGISVAGKMFFSQSIEHPTIQSFLLDATRYKNTGKLVSYTGDELRWEINAPIEGYLSFIDNWAQGWKVFVDEKEADIELLFGTFKSVRLAPGQHNIRFSYQPGLI